MSCCNNCLSGFPTVASKADLPIPGSPGASGLSPGAIRIALNNGTIWILTEDLAFDPLVDPLHQRWVQLTTSLQGQHDIELFSAAVDVSGAGAITAFLANAAEGLAEAQSAAALEFPYFRATGGGTILRLTTNVLFNNVATQATDFTVFVDGVATAMTIHYAAGDVGIKETLVPVVAASGARGVDIQMTTTGRSSGGAVFLVSAALELATAGT